MKVSHLLNVILAVALVAVSIRLATVGTHREAEMPGGVTNKTDSTLTAFDVIADKDTLASFTFFANSNHGLLLCAGDSVSGSNAMTIGWGAIGTLWGRWRPTVTVYVAENRYTRQFLERSPYFTVMHFKDNNIVDYMGTHSGRDGNKAAALGLHTRYTKNGAPYYAEADLVLECRIMYGGGQFDPEKFRDDVPRNLYADFPPGKHYMYMGEVVGAWKRQ